MPQRPPIGRETLAHQAPNPTPFLTPTLPPDLTYLQPLNLSDWPASYALSQTPVSTPSPIASLIQMRQTCYRPHQWFLPQRIKRLDSRIGCARWITSMRRETTFRVSRNPHIEWSTEA